MMVSARRVRLPKVRAALGTSAEVIGAQFINASEAEAKFRRESRRAKLTGPQLSKKMAD